MSTVPSPDFQEVRRLVVRGVNWLGDAVMTTPALTRLREAFPAVHLALLTPAKLADLWRHWPGLDEIIPIENGDSVWQVARRLRTARFDAAILWPNSPRSALEPWLAGIPRRIGYARPWRTWLLTDPIPARKGIATLRKRSLSEIRRAVEGAPAPSSVPDLAGAHQVLHYLHLVAAVGASSTPLPPRLTVTNEEMNAVCRRLGLLADDGRLPVLLGLNPGAEYGPAKRWPLERYLAVALQVQQRTGARWLILGGAGDQELASRLCADLLQAVRTPGQPAAAPRPDGAMNLAGKTSLRELCAVLKACRVVLTNDTGPMHVAAAVGTPVVVPFGSTSPEFTGPGLPGETRHRLLRVRVPCSPCFQRACPIDFRCMTGIAIDEVVRAVMDVIQTNPLPL